MRFYGRDMDAEQLVEQLIILRSMEKAGFSRCRKP